MLLEPEISSEVKYRHTNRPGFWFGFIDFFTAGIFFLFYMPLGHPENDIQIQTDSGVVR